MNLYAIVENNDIQSVYRIPLSGSIQTNLASVFAQQSINLFSDREEVEFDGNYNANDEEIFIIRNYPITQEILDSVANPLNCDILDIENLDGKVKAIFATTNQANQTQINFQYFDSRKILANRGISLYLSGDTYRTFDTKGIVISESITAIFKDSDLYFKSYFNTRKFLNLVDFYEEATEEDIDDFVGQSIFSFEDAIGFRDDLNSRLRKKIKGIQQRGVLQNNSATEIRDKAHGFGISFDIDNGQLVLPRNKSLMRDLIRFLDEDYFVTPLTDRRCITNSKREVN
ncbi:Kiwa anti-phage protein KwaB-like domain-containing protein [Winogradskyella sp. Asnod2-B02-A]|uniref:Kiwa anti-phage protein KwaB-like domain-containing protein n=1 Tax=Winogradskyella sp. Asnod2-B02-A TaxID=3160583 RepID=UPI00386A7168